MKILVTGATGFVGCHVVRALLARGHAVTAVTRDVKRAKKNDWSDSVSLVEFDIHKSRLKAEQRLGSADVVMHLAWQGLPNYGNAFHFEKNFPANREFLKSLVFAGYKHLLVTGTCLEYGMQSGRLSESMEPRPTTPYGKAKDVLRIFLQMLQKKESFVLQWARLFYMYGEGQHPDSLLAQLDRAIDRCAESFDMSGGEQLRDYLPVTEVAARLVSLIEHPELSGVVNICKGVPISVRALVENRIAERGARIKLNLGRYPYPDHEPMEFWGDDSRIKQIYPAPCRAGD